MATLDILFARAYWQHDGATFARVFQSVAAGVLGKASYQGGATSAWLGAGLHYFIVTCMALAYFLASRWLPVLTRRPVAMGIAYGVVLYGFMNLIVLPLSAVGMPSFANVRWVGASIVMHALFGVMCAFAARLAGDAPATGSFLQGWSSTRHSST